MKRSLWWIPAVVIAAAAIIGLAIWAGQNVPRQRSIEVGPSPRPPGTATLPAATTTPAGVSVLPGNVLIADRGNNRLIEVTPDRRIVWQYNFNSAFPDLKPGQGADDSFFTPSGQSIIVNLEDYHLIAELAYPSGQIVWQYGHPGQAGSKPGYLDTPDDAYRWPDGLTSVADIRNCRVIFINQQGEIVRQFGHTGQCLAAPGYYDAPNGDTPLPDGHMLISVINEHQLIEVAADGTELLRLALPMSYPSDPQKLRDGNYLVADYAFQGRIVEITPGGQVVWQYVFPNDPQRGLNHPSLAEQLPDGNIIVTDDWNHRVVVIDYHTQQIVWQYGVTSQRGSDPGYLDTPDGLDIRYK